MLAAVAAGMTAVGVTTGATSDAELLATGAGLVFDSLAGLLDYLAVDVPEEGETISDSQVS